MDISDTPYYQKLIASSNLIGETIAPSLDVVNAMQPAIEQAKKIIASQDTLIASQAILNDSLIQIVEKHNKSIANMIPPSVFPIQKVLDLPSLNIANQIVASTPDFSEITQAYRSIISNLPKYDFRIDVVSQELELVFSEEPEEASEKLLFEETPEPSNKLEAQFFDILNQQRKILNDSENILKKINHTQSKNITEEPSNKKHDSPAFYKDKMWYIEQIASNLIGLVVVAIFNATIGVDPSNTLKFALLLGCLLHFIRPKP